MSYVTLAIEFARRRVVVVGAGAVACRKVRGLVSAGGDVRVVAPEADAEIRELAGAGRIVWKRAVYHRDDLDGVFLVVAATNDVVLNRRIAADARQNGILVNVASPPDSGDCQFPAVLQRGHLEIAVSSSGRCPSFAVAVRDLLAGQVDERYATALERMASLREKLLTEGKASPYNGQVLREQARKLLAELTEPDKDV